MAAVLAPHHTSRATGYVADRYGNDPFVWVQPFLWSHCHARSRSPTFGQSAHGPFVEGKDAVFFVSHDPASDQVVCDCVFVIEEVLPIEEVEARFAASHPIRHYHFDQSRSKHHLQSTLTRVANSSTSFVLDPPMPLGPWIESHVKQRSMPVLEYFSLKKRKNVRVVTTDAQGIYERCVEWTSMPSHRTLASLPLETLRAVELVYPGEEEIEW